MEGRLDLLGSGLQSRDFRLGGDAFRREDLAFLLELLAVVKQCRTF